MNDARKTVLITGATSGLGLALARRYLGRSPHFPGRVLLVGRRPIETLDPSIFTPESYARVDLTEADAADRVARFLADRRIERLDRLIHNAALGWYGPLDEQQETSVHAILGVNLWAPLAMTHRLLPLVRRARGTVVIISSVASAIPAPEYAVYAASKAALEMWARNLGVELAGKVAVQVIRPGPTRTGLHEKLGIPNEQAHTERFADPDIVAARIVRAIERGRTGVSIGLTNAILHHLGRRFPRAVDGVLCRRRKPTRQTSPPNNGDSPRYRAGTATASGDRELGLPHCVITGASAGIGNALARQFLQSGARVTGIDRDPPADGCQARCGAFAGHVADLGDPGGIALAIDALVAGPTIDVLIHNAGINHVAPFAESDLKQQQEVLAVNLLAPMLLTAAVLRERKMAAGGTIVFIASLCHFTGYPGASVYAATKDGLVSYARSLAVAVAPRRINVLTVFPGPTRTAHARRYSPDNRREHRRMPPERLATMIADAVHGRQTRLVPGLGNRLFALTGHWLPGLTAAILRRTILQRIE